jgi:uncharacterized phage-associated protein
MDTRFNMQKGKVINSILFLLDKLGGQSDLHKIFKILYFADQKHLVSFGVPITGDFYIAMENGPVPSKIYDMLKAIRGDSFFGNIVPEYRELLDVKGRIIILKKSPDLDELAESNIECLLTAFKENQNLTFNELSDKSHKTAWEKAINSEGDFYKEINVLDIAKEGNANEEMIKFISLNLENQTLINSYA